MPFIHLRNNPQRRSIITELFNSSTTGASSALALDTQTPMIVSHKNPNNTFSFVIEGSVIDSPLDQDWVAIGSAVTTSVGTLITAPYPYLRVRVTTNVATTRTASSVTQTAGVATFNCVSHAFLAGDIVTISGATGGTVGFNVTKARVLTAAANSFTYAVDAGTTTPATGTVIATGHHRIYCSE